MNSEQVEELVCVISSLDRRALLHQFQEFTGNFPVDFTPEFLQAQTLDRLRHLLFALCMQCKYIPDLAAQAA